MSKKALIAILMAVMLVMVSVFIPGCKKPGDNKETGNETQDSGDKESITGGNEDKPVDSDKEDSQSGQGDQGD